MKNNECAPGLSTSSIAPDSFREHHPADPSAISRRRLLGRGAAASGFLWVTPLVDSFTVASAQGTNPQPDPTATVTMWKWNNSPPTPSTVCATGPTGNANRGNVVLTRLLQTDTIQAVITITSGPAINGNGTCTPGVGGRDVVFLQSDAFGNCLSQTTATEGCFTAPNNTPQTFTAPIVAGASHFALVLLESGGGGTDTYSTTRAVLPAA